MVPDRNRGFVRARAPEPVDKVVTVKDTSSPFLIVTPRKGFKQNRGQHGSHPAGQGAEAAHTGAGRGRGWTLWQRGAGGLPPLPSSSFHKTAVHLQASLGPKHRAPGPTQPALVWLPGSLR